MRRSVIADAGWSGVMLLGLWLCAACGDSGVAVTDGSSGSSTGTTDEPTPTTGTPTTDPPPTDPTTTSTTDTTDTPTTPTTTFDTTTTTGDTDTTTTGATDTMSDTDTTTGGVEVVGRSLSQTVNAGVVANSPNFRMVFTLGQPTANQSTTTSPNFRLQGGLIGANGSPP